MTPTQIEIEAVKAIKREFPKGYHFNEHTIAAIVSLAIEKATAQAWQEHDDVVEALRISNETIKQLGARNKQLRAAATPATGSEEQEITEVSTKQGEKWTVEIDEFGDGQIKGAGQYGIEVRSYKCNATEAQAAHNATLFNKEEVWNTAYAAGKLVGSSTLATPLSDYAAIAADAKEQTRRGEKGET